ncbi:MAG: hypothetical protein L6Q99_12060 [Planctomycetes bacterium]|nr:hypothetical protein [Planctomycetota bacterium]
MPGDTNGGRDVYIYDTWTRTYELASANAKGEIGNNDSGIGFIAPGGRTVAFTSDAYNFLPGYGHTFKNRAYVKNLDTGTIEALYQNPDGTPASGGASGDFELSFDGRYVAFETLGAAYPHVSGPKGFWSVYRRDMQRAIGEDVGVTLEGGRADSEVDQTSMSADARFFAMLSSAKNLTPISGGWDDVFVRDHSLGVVSMVNFGDHGQLQSGQSVGPEISDDGRVVAFNTGASLVPSDVEGEDVYVVARDFAEPAHYCNTLPNADGCATRIDATDLECPNRPSGPQLVVADAPANSRALLLYGTAGGDITPLGSSGWLCVRPPLAKLALVQSGTSVSCGGRFAFDFGAWIDAGKDPALVDGTRVCLQFWVSDPTGATHGVLTDALAFRIANAKR